VLGVQYGVFLENGEIELRFDTSRGRELRGWYLDRLPSHHMPYLDHGAGRRTSGKT